MQPPAGDIEVVVLDRDDEPEVTRPPMRPRPWSAAIVALIATLAVLGLPVADPEVADPGPTTASTSLPDRSSDGCPPPESLRLWCSFLADSPCCPGGAPADGSPVSGFIMATSPSTGGSAFGGSGTGGKVTVDDAVTEDAAGGCGDQSTETADPSTETAVRAQRALTRRA